MKKTESSFTCTVMVLVLTFHSVYCTNQTVAIEAVRSLFLQKCENSPIKNYSTINIPGIYSMTNESISLTIIPYSNFCPYDHTHHIILEKHKVSNKNSKYKLTENGELVWPGRERDEAGNTTTREFCVLRSNYDLIELSICLVPCNNSNTACIPKCCDADELFNITSNSCQKTSKHWIPLFHHESSSEEHRILTDRETMKYSIHYLPMLKLCERLFNETHLVKHKSIIESPDGHTEVRLLTNGEIISKWHEDENWELFTDSCIDGEINGLDNILIDLNCSKQPYDFKDQENDAKMQITIKLIHAILMVLCSLFLLAAFIIHVALWDKQNTHGWTVMTYILSLFFAYIFLAIYKFIATDENMTSKGWGCKINGILAHFFFQSVFTWLTVINFDIWWKFWDLKSQPVKAKDVSRYIKYALFAFGVPFLIILIGLILQKIGWGIAPGYGYEVCFLQKDALGVYLYYPVGVLMILNFIFFISTAFKIYSHFKLTSNVHEAKSQQEMESFKVIIKLFIVMGVTWVFELLGFIIERKISNFWSTVLWTIFDCGNILQAIGIFIIFIWKRVILTQLWMKYHFIRPFLRLLKGLPGCRKRVDYNYSARMTTKSTKSTNSANISGKMKRNRKLSDSGQQTSFETVDL